METPQPGQHRAEIDATVNDDAEIDAAVDAEVDASVVDTSVPLTADQMLEAQGQWTALRSAFSLQHLAHAHNQIRFGMIIDPAGLPAAVYLLGGAFAASAWGYLMDRIGRRNGIVLGLLIGVVGNALVLDLLLDPRQLGAGDQRSRFYRVAQAHAALNDAAAERRHGADGDGVGVEAMEVVLARLLVTRPGGRLHWRKHRALSVSARNLKALNSPSSNTADARTASVLGACGVSPGSGVRRSVIDALNGLPGRKRTPPEAK